jgi:D-inositol-3-phosphate glycosyltransferase
VNISLLTGGSDKPYALGLLEALVRREINVDFIGNDDMSKAEIVSDRRVNFLNLRGDQSEEASFFEKTIRVLKYYICLVKYAAQSNSKVFHILWFNRFLVLDRSVLNIYYRLLGKRLVLTAHNIDERERDGGGNPIHRASLWVLYHIVDHIFVHTKKMKTQLIREFKVPEAKISVIPFGINNTLPTTDLTRSEARANFGYKKDDRVLLFFGNIAPYKGLEYMIYALDSLRKRDDRFRLIIAGQIKNCRSYWISLERMIKSFNLGKHIHKVIEYVPDEEVELYFKAADVLLLPYKFIYQSGVLFLSYSFVLPVIATDVGSLREDVVDGKTGAICRAEDPEDLKNKISAYFDSDLFRDLESNRRAIIANGNRKNSWDEAANSIINVYNNLDNRERKK